MKKQLIIITSLFIGVKTTAQVGINNQSPKATLDITAKNTNGSTAEGLIAPRLTGDQIKAADAQYGIAQKGAMVYATAAVTTASTKTAAITAEGYYYFDGSLWQKVANGSTYSGSSSVVINGSAFERAALTGDVTALQNSNATTIANNAVTSAKISDGTIATVDIANNAVTVAKLPSGATGTNFLRGDGTWAIPADNNIYTTDGTLTGDRNVNLATRNLGFTGNGNIGIGTATPNTSAVLDVNATNKGFLTPRMTSAQRDLITMPATGLIVFSTTDSCLQINNGTPAVPDWKCLAIQKAGGAPVVQVSSFTSNDPAGQIASEICLGSICTRHDGQQGEGSIQLRSNNGVAIPVITVSGYQVATSGVNSGNTEITSLATTYGTKIFYRGGASGGEFIYYQISTIDGENYRVFLTLVPSSLAYGPGSYDGKYLLNLERVR